MAVTPAELLSPTGEIEGAALWPGENDAAVSARLAGYIADGVDKAARVTDPGDNDAAVKAWAYHRAYQAVFVALSRIPSTVALNDQGSASMLVTQIQNFKDLADDKLTEFNGLLPAGEGTATTVAPASVSAPTTFTW